MPQTKNKKEKYIVILSFEKHSMSDIECIERCTYEDAVKIAERGMVLYNADSYKIIPANKKNKAKRW